MMTDSMKRQTSLNLLQKLRKQGLPQREEQVDSMFDSLMGGGKPGESELEDGEDEGGEAPEYELQSPEQQAKEREKKKSPNLDQSKVEKFKKGFMGTK